MTENIIHTIALNLTDKLNTHANKEGIDLLKMTLGIEIFLINIPKIIFILIISMVLGILPQTLTVFLSFAVIRRYACGLHAKKSITCTLVSMLMFVAVPYVLNGIEVNLLALTLIFIVVIILLYKYAPADTDARPIIGQKQRKLLKKKAIIASAVLFLLALSMDDGGINLWVAIGMVYGVVAILPHTYKILGRSVNNYEEYE